MRCGLRTPLRVAVSWFIPKLLVILKKNYVFHIRDTYISVNVCRSAPFFIALLGERYGQHRQTTAGPLPQSLSDLTPDTHWLDRSYLVAAESGHEWILNDDGPYCSVTELEIRKAIYRDKIPHCYFYLRDPDHIDDKFPELDPSERLEKLKMFHSESPSAAKRLQELKDNISDLGCPLRHFRTPEELGNLVLRDWTELIEKIYEKTTASVSKSE